MEQEKKISIFEIVWIFILGCIIGYVFETLFYIVKYHYYVNKQGLLYGPFKPIYGFGALFMTFSYYLIKKKSSFNIIISGVFIGSLFEYIASIILEYVFHSYIWDYSSFPLNINGRIYLPYCFLWGILSLIWIKFLYLPLKKYFNIYITKNWFKLLSFIISIIIVFDLLLTGVILLRQGYRNKTNYIFKIIDKYYSEDDIHKKFPKFRPLE